MAGQWNGLGRARRVMAAGFSMRLAKSSPRGARRSALAALARRSGVIAALCLPGLVLPSSPPVHAQAMALGGQFDVGANGAASYSIPIVVAPGTGGMVPALTLDYSSDGGNGLLGMVMVGLTKPSNTREGFLVLTAFPTAP